MNLIPILNDYVSNWLGPQELRLELKDRLENLCTLSGTPMSPELHKWVTDKFGLEMTRVIEDYSTFTSPKLSPDLLSVIDRIVPNNHQGDDVNLYFKQLFDVGCGNLCLYKGIAYENEDICYLYYEFYRNSIPSTYQPNYIAPSGSITQLAAPLTSYSWIDPTTPYLSRPRIFIYLWSTTDPNGEWKWDNFCNQYNIPFTLETCTPQRPECFNMALSYPNTFADLSLNYFQFDAINIYNDLTASGTLISDPIFLQYLEGFYGAGNVTINYDDGIKRLDIEITNMLESITAPIQIGIADNLLSTSYDIPFNPCP